MESRSELGESARPVGGGKRSQRLDHPRTWTACVLVMAVGCLAMPGAAAEWSNTEVQLLRGDGFELGLEEREIITLQHSSGWSFGSNFFFFDIVQPFAGDTGIYGEWYSRFSLRKIVGKDRSRGVIGDVSAAVAINAGSDFRAYLAGVTVHFNAPGFTFLALDVMVYDDRSRDGTTYILTPSWDLPFTLGRARLRFRGFADLIGPEAGSSRHLLTQPQLLVDVGAIWGSEGRLWAGVEYQYWWNKYGIDGVREALPQVMVMWSF